MMLKSIGTFAATLFLGIANFASADANRVTASGRIAVTIFYGIEYVTPGIPPLNVTITQVSCINKFCTFMYNNLPTSGTGGTAIGGKELFRFVSRCNGAYANRLTCSGSGDEFGAPNPEGFTCVAECR